MIKTIHILCDKKENRIVKCINFALQIINQLIFIYFTHGVIGWSVEHILVRIT